MEWAKSLDAEFAEGAEFRRVERATAKAGLSTSHHKDENVMLRSI